MAGLDEVSHKLKTSTINVRQFEEICDRVWNDRASLLKGSGNLSGEAALVRAIFWRLRKAGIKTTDRADAEGSTPELVAYQMVIVQMLKSSSRPPFVSTSILNALIDRYQSEVADANAALVHPR